MTAPTRRAALASILAAGTVASVPAAAALASTSPELTPTDQRALDLWKRLRRLLAIRARLDLQYDAAEAQMPAWARGGPAYVHPDGSPADEGQAGWPMVADLAQEPVLPSGLILARPQVENLYERWRRDALLGDRDTATRELDRALAAHVERLRQQAAERERTGVAIAEERLEAAGEAMSAVETEIAAARLEGSVLALAAALMVEIRVDEDERWTRLCLASLAAIRPQLVGVIAEDADRVSAQHASTEEA